MRLRSIPLNLGTTFVSPALRTDAAHQTFTAPPNKRSRMKATDGTP